MEELKNKMYFNSQIILSNVTGKNKTIEYLKEAIEEAKRKGYDGNKM